MVGYQCVSLTPKLIAYKSQLLVSINQNTRTVLCVENELASGVCNYMCLR